MTPQEWLDAQLEYQTCHRCGKTGSKEHVHPLYPSSESLCDDCIDKEHRRYWDIEEEMLA